MLVSSRLSVFKKCEECQLQDKSVEILKVSYCSSRKANILCTVYYNYSYNDIGMEPTHAVVQFVDDESICCLPMKMVDIGLSKQPELSSIYFVQWTNRKKYQAVVLALGKLIISLIVIINGNFNYCINFRQ